MTEAEWLSAAQFDDAMYSAALAAPSWSFRKQTWFSVACCRRVLAVHPDERGANLLADFETAALAPTESLSVDFARPLSDYVIEALYDPNTPSSQSVLFALGAVTRGYIS